MACKVCGRCLPLEGTDWWMAYIVCLIFLYNFSGYNAVISLKRPVDVPGQTYGYNLSGHICLEGEWGEMLGGGGGPMRTLCLAFL